MSIILERYIRGGANRFTCPQCGKKKCFTRYKNTETNEYIDESCGKCDHEISCGYHYPPKQYFQNHPSAGNYERGNYPHIIAPKARPLCFIPYSYVEKSHLTTSNFMSFLINKFGDCPTVHQAFDNYMLGATRSNGVIYWQIDYEGRVRTGKVMHYMPDGHRAEVTYFIHYKMKDKKLLPSDWIETQCLFGEHLLKYRPNDMVNLVESEKTAVIGSIFYPQFIWIATSGCNGLKKEKLNHLVGRTVRVYPDSGEYDKWKQEMEKTSGIKYSIVKDLEEYPPNTDIADLLLK